MTSQPEWYESWMARTSQMLLRMDARIEQNEKRIEQNEKLIARMDTQIEQGKRDAEKTRRLWIAVARHIGLDGVDFED